MKLDTSNYKTIIGYGIGEYYERHKREILQAVKPDYLCDRKWDDTELKEYDGIPVIQRTQMDSMEKLLVVIMVGNRWQEDSIRDSLLEVDADIVCISEFFSEKTVITGKELKEKYKTGRYEDVRGNTILFDGTISDHITVCFMGEGNVLRVEKSVAVISLWIQFGSYGSCTIGAGTELLGDSFYVSGAELTVGRDCLFADDVTVRTHDGHHIFALDTKERVNEPQDVRIGNQVWIAHGVTLLGGAQIGDGSVVGTGSVTSRVFGDHLIVAGCPARVIRENICWSRDSQEYCNRREFRECIDQTAIKYLRETERENDKRYHTGL